MSRHRWLAPERLTATGVSSPTFKADVWSFGLLCLEVFTDTDPYCAYQDFYLPVLLSQGKSPEHPGTAAVGLSSKMWELMQSCWEVDSATRPDMLHVQLAMRDILPLVEPRPTLGLTVIASHPSTSPAQSEPLLPTLVPPRIEPSYKMFKKNSCDSSMHRPSPPTNRTPPTKLTPPLSRSAGSGATRTLSSTATSLKSLPLSSLQEDDRSPSVPKSLSVPSRSSAILPILNPIRLRVPVSDEVLGFLKGAANGPESLLRPAKDGTVSAGNLEGFLSRVISDSADSSKDKHFKSAFLTIYRLFATSERVFEILKRLFEATSVDPSVASSRYS
jgi:hypothetical protein